MTTTPIGISITPDLTPGASTSPAAPATPPATPQTPDLDPQDFRLVIEDDKAAGSFVYKTIDRRTGEVVSQLPREQILVLRETPTYVAGTVIQAKA